MSTYYDLDDYIYVLRSDGYRSKRYRHWCSVCSVDRGYAYKNKIARSPMCHSCKMKQSDVRQKIGKREFKHTAESRQKISDSLYARYSSNRLNSKIASNLRSRLNKAVKNGYKSGSAVRELGCSIEELKTYLESKFYPHPITGEMMTWDNYGRGGWHIDHVGPLCMFNLSDGLELRRACHYTNLQPLWAEDNLTKRHHDGTFKDPRV